MTVTNSFVRLSARLTLHCMLRSIGVVVERVNPIRVGVVNSVSRFSFMSSQFHSTANVQAASQLLNASASGKKIRILTSFPLPPPTIELMQTHPVWKDLSIELLTADGDMEISSAFKAELTKYAPIDGLVCRPGNNVDAEAINLCGNTLKAISSLSVGFNHIDLRAAAKKGILVGHSPNTVTHTTADTALTLMLAASRLVIAGHENVIKGEWGKQPFSCYHLAGRDLHHATVGIIGLGRIGVEVAKRVKGFHCKILYASHSGEKREAAEEVGAEYTTLDDLLQRSDFVVPQVPLNDTTRGMFNKERFARMKPTAVFVNTTRGGVVNQEDLAEALKDGTIFAAGLDVTDPEPLPPSHPLVGLPNCLILPHLGTATKQCRHETAEVTIDNLMQALLLPGGGSGIYCNRKMVEEEKQAALK